MFTERNLRFLQRAARHLELICTRPRVSASMVYAAAVVGGRRRLMWISWPAFMVLRARPMMRLAQWDDAGSSGSSTSA